jgi:hypothetical protein
VPETEGPWNRRYYMLWMYTAGNLFALGWNGMRPGQQEISDVIKI